MNHDPKIILRTATPADRPFLQRVYAESRAAELAAVEWTVEQKADFCRTQFEAQDRHYRQHYPGCEFLIVKRAGKPVGRLYKHRRSDEIRIVDIALLESARGSGIGSRLIQEILDEASVNDVRVRIHVERSNPARRLYDRLGFRLEEEGEVYDLLVWQKPI